MAQSSARSSGCRAVSIRTGLVLGSEGLLPRLALPMRLFADGRPVGNGRQWLPWIHENDVARAYLHALDTGSLDGPVNTCSPDAVTMSDFARALGRELNRPSWLPVPEFALRIVLGEVAPFTLMSQRAVPARLEATGFGFVHPRLPEALHDLLGAR